MGLSLSIDGSEEGWIVKPTDTEVEFNLHIVHASVYCSWTPLWGLSYYEYILLYLNGNFKL